MNTLSLNILGAGKVGQTLARLFHEEACFTIQGVLSRSLKKAESAVQFIGAGKACTALDELPLADVYMLTLPDTEIEHVAVALKKIFSEHAFQPKLVFHCSGAISSAALSCLSEDGIQIASIHPAITFAEPTHHFAHTYCAFEGDSAAFPVLESAFTRIGGHVFVIPSEKKVLYHAANVMACNYLVALMDMALGMYEKAGLTQQEALAVMRPLVEKTLDNTFTLGSVKALTGPIARGDVMVVEHHLRAIEDEGVKTVYRVLGLQAVELVCQRGEVSEERLEKMRKILKP